MAPSKRNRAQKAKTSFTWILLLALLPIIIIAALTAQSLSSRAQVIGDPPVTPIAYRSPTPSMISPTLPPFPSKTPTPTPARTTPIPTGFPTGIPAPSVFPTPYPGNRLKNPSFETDANNDGKPENWTQDSRAIRSSQYKHQGKYALKLSAKNNASFSIGQTVQNITSSQKYTVSGWLRIPPTNDSLTVTLLVRWRDKNFNVLRTDTITRESKPTSDWVGGSLSPSFLPAGTTNARVQINVTSLNGTVFVDDFALRSQ